VPFVIKNIPALNNARAKWTWEWLNRKIGTTQGRVELPSGTDGDGAHGNNHLMFWRSGGSDPPGYKQPTSHGRWNFDKWYQEASKTPLSNGTFRAVTQTRLASFKDYFLMYWNCLELGLEFM
jgi:hypothetical protein